MPDALQIVYFFPTELPNPHSHGVQALHSARALAEAGARVELIVEKLGGTAADVFAHYGMQPHPGLTLRTFAPCGSKLNRWSGRGFRMALRWLAIKRSRETGPVVFYFRGAEHALEAINTIAPVCRFFKRQVVYEAHAIQWRDIGQMHAGRYGEGAALEAYIEKRHALERQACGNLNAVVCISSRLKELLKEEFSLRVPALIAPSGVRLQSKTPPPLAGREFDVAYVGRLFPFNGVELLLDALAQVPHAKGVIVGDGEPGSLDRLKVRAASLGIACRVSFIGGVPHAEALAWMRRARVLAAPLLPVGQIDRVTWCSPGKIAEYMAAGGAIIAPRLPNLADVLRDDENARLFAPGDVYGLAEAMSELLMDPSDAQRLSDQALADVGKLTFEARAKAIIGFLESLR